MSYCNLNRKAILPLSLIVASIIISVLWVSVKSARPTQITSNEFDFVSSLKEHATVLANDDFNGREAGTGDDSRAAQYIADQFSNIGLKPIGNQKQNSFIQPFKFEAWWSNKELNSFNVVGMIEGTDLKHEFIVIGAHYDHVGNLINRHYGQYEPRNGNDLIYNGADDNASGTSALITIASAYKRLKTPTRRSIIFIAFGAEEGGLFGSKYYCEHPSIGSIGDYVLMINLDMVGRNPERPVDIIGVRNASGDILRDVVKASSCHFPIPPNITDRFLSNGGDSDHSSFDDVGVPNLFFFTGLHADYHRVSDHSDRLNYIGISDICKATIEISMRIANLQDRLIYQK